MTKTVTCVTCPVGCTIEIEYEDGKILSMKGNRCARGKAYAENEFYRPARILTTTIYIPEADDMLPVRTDLPVPKEELFECLRRAKELRVKLPVRRGDVLLRGISGEANLIASAALDRPARP